IIEQNPMIDFVFKAPTFPRSLFFCIDMLRRELKQLPKHKDALAHTDKVRRRLQRYRNLNNDRAKLHKFIDTMQLALIQLNAEITARWFTRRSE
ncbi:MAG: alpha-E domain-containing protein, partial [Pseudomonadales bacterium]